MGPKKEKRKEKEKKETGKLRAALRKPVAWALCIAFVLCAAIGYHKFSVIADYTQTAWPKGTTNTVDFCIKDSPTNSQGIRVNFTADWDSSEDGNKTKSNFEARSRTVYFSKVANVNSNSYGASLQTSKYDTYKDSEGNYTVVQLTIRYTIPAHWVKDKDYVNKTASGNARFNVSGAVAHSTSSHTVDITYEINLSQTGIITDNESVRHNNHASYADHYIKKNTYTLYYNANGGTCTSTSKTITCGGYYGTLPDESATTRDGYTFEGWYTGAANGSQADEDDVLCNGDKTIYAHWTANTYTVSFDGNGADSGEMEDVTFTHGTSGTLPANKFKWTGHEFEGWSFLTEGEVMLYDKGTVNNLDTLFKSDSLTLYAIWHKLKFTITFNSRGGTGTMSKQTGSGASAELKECTFEREGYEFLGWATSVLSSEVVYEDGAEVPYNSSGYTLYAVWQKEAAIFDLSNVTEDSYMFSGDVSLIGGQGSGYDVNIVDSKGAHIDGGDSDIGYFTAK